MVLGDLHDISYLKDKVEIVCAGVGDPILKRFVMKTKFAGFKIANALIHPSVYISKRNAIGVGSIICEGSTITTNIKIGNFVIINRGSNISHDDSIGDYVTVGIGLILLVMSQ